jgi:SAM-dependent methyltransferase
MTSLYRWFYNEYWGIGLGDWCPRELSATYMEQLLITSNIMSSKRILDIGCGDGRLAKVLTKLGAGVFYVGLDISIEAAYSCRRSGHDVMLCDVSKSLPFRDASFDLVLFFEVLEHLFLPQTVVQEIHRVLRCGGIMVGSVPNIAYLPNIILFMLGYFNPGGSPATSLKTPYRDPHVRFFTARTLRRMITEAGFDSVNIIGEPFSLVSFPILYRLSPGPRKLLAAVSRPIGWLGTAWPSLFGSRLYFQARKL